MADPKVSDPMVSSEQEVEVDAKTAAAIARGIDAAEKDRVVPAEEVRKRVTQWTSKSSTPTQR